MAETTNTATIKVVLDADGVDAGLRKIDQGAAQTTRVLENLGKSNGVNALGDGAVDAAGKFAGGTKTIIDAIQRRAVALEMGKKGTVEYYTALASSKGIDTAALKPYLDQLDAVTRKTAQAAEAQKKLDDGAAFINGLRARTQEIGKSSSELAAMRAAQLGVSETAQPLIEQLRAAEEAASGLGGTLGIAGTALQAFAAAAVAAMSISAVAAGIQTAIDALASLDDMAQKSGSSVESLSQLQKVAQMTGQDFGEVNSAVNKLAKGMGGLDIDSNKVLGALKTLGVSATDSAGKLRAPSEVMIEAAKKFQNYADGAGKAKLANDLFKGSGADLLPYLNDVAESVDGFTGSSTAAATKASEFGDNMGAVRVHVGELWTEIATNLLPSMIKFSKYVKDITEGDRFKKFMVDAGKAAASFAEAVEKIAPVIVSATKIVATYFGLFVLAPNAFKLAAVGLEIFWLAAQLAAAKVATAGGVMAGLNTTLWGTGLSAQFASGWMGKLKIAGGVLLAFFAGWEIGKLLYEEFDWARVGGLMFVETVLIGFEQIKAGCIIAFDLLAAGWNGALGTMKVAFSGYLTGVAEGLAKIGATDVSKNVAAYADSLLKAGAVQISSAKGVGAAVAKTAAEYEKNVTAIKANIKELTAYAAISDRISVKDGVGGPPKVEKPEAPRLKEDDGSAAKQANAYAKLTASIQEKIAANELELLTGDAVSESQKMEIKLNYELREKIVTLSKEEEKLTRIRLAGLAVSEKNLKLSAAEKGVGEYIKQNTLAREASVAALASEYELYGKGSDARDIAAVGLRNEAELKKRLFEMEKAKLPVSQQLIDQMRESTKEKERDEKATMAQSKALNYASKLADDNRRYAAESITDERERAAALLEIDAEMWRERIALAGEGTEAQKLLQSEFTTWYKNQSGKAAMDEWRKSVQQYDDIFRTGFADMLNNGQNGWKSFTKSLVTTFKTSVADQIYKMFAQPFVMKLVASLVGVTGGGAVSGAAQAVGITGSGGLDLSSISGIASAAKAAYGAISTGFSGISTAVADGVQTILYETGLSTKILTNGAVAKGAGAVAGYAAGAAVGVYAGRAVSNGYAVSGSGNGMVNAGTIAGAIFAGPIGAAIGGLIGGAANRLFGRKPREYGDSTIVGSFGTDGFAGTTNTPWVEKGGVFRSSKRDTDKVAVDSTSAAAFTAGYDALKAASIDFASVLGIQADAIKTHAQSMSIKLTKDQAANEKLIADFFIGVGDSIALELLPTLGDFKMESENASSTLQRLAVDYAFIDAALQAIGDTFGAVGVGSIKAREYLLELSGGMEAFGKDVAYFSQNYLTEAERLAPVAKSVEAAFKELQVAAPKTREEFKALVMGLDLTSANGAKTYAGLMNIQEAFAQLNPALEEAAAKVRSRADIEKERAGLQDQFDQLAMTPEAYRQKQVAKQRADVDPSNLDLFDNVQYGAAADAANAAARAAADSLAATNKSYQDQIDAFEKVGKKAAAVRELEIKGMDATTIVLYDLVKAYEASAASAAAAAQLASVNKGYEDRIFEIEKPGMDPEKVREREIEGMDATTVKLYDKLKALEAARAAQEALDRAEKERIDAARRDQEEMARAQQRLAEDAARAAEQIKSAWQSVTDSIFDEVARIRGIATGNGAQTLASAQAEFAIKNAQAQAGNQDAAKLLPSISQKLIELAEANATSLIDLQRIRARTAASLDATGAILAARFGLTLPSLAVGTNYLPSDMVIQAHQGERVIPAADNRALMQMINRPAPADTSGAAQQQANAEMVGLRAEVRSIAISNAAVAGMLKRVIKDDKLQTEDA
ncbi:hypothetical protein F2P45_31785 [Massilia sp. CCM 8733]|uniref:Bacteriophage tail tape measure N-terminal domain-containing protein n=1 Tax=Massilia mucilaginosa TaxID=2609282 RepID=A0ABX0P2J6_9BURK|nr:hypothetical protein [Massilia mucilaginosa]NHZ93549.1 hypothetical protein [Massilia mucilaginosa]